MQLTYKTFQHLLSMKLELFLESFSQITLSGKYEFRSRIYRITGFLNYFGLQLC